MPKTNCNIIKDLLPSYIDGICSPESEQLIKEHMTECENCQTIYHHLQIDISTVNAFPTKEVDALKKIRRNTSQKNMILYAIIFVLFLLQLYLYLNIYRLTNAFFMYFNYLFPVLIAGILFPVLPNYAEHEIPSKIKFPILAIEFGLITYLPLSLIYFLNKKTLFHMSPHNIGPFFNIQLNVLFVFFFLAFVTTSVFSIRKKSVCPALYFVPLGGISLMFEYQRFLRTLSTEPQIQNILNPYLIFVGEMILLVGLYLFIDSSKNT